MLGHILPLITPKPGEACYVEPFGGSAVVMLNKLPHPSETYNDTDGDLVNLFRIIRDPDGVVHLWWELINTPVAREEFGAALEAKRQNFSPPDPVRRAAQFVIRCRQRFGGGQSGVAHMDTDRSWGTARQSSRDMNSCVSRRLATMLALPQVHRRMMTVVVDNQDAVRCITQWDSAATMFYVDPPYIGAEDYYQGGFGADDHARLADALNAASGRAVVSYYPRPTLDALYPEKRWYRQAVRVYATASGNAPRAPGSPAIKLSAVQRRVELILSNFDPRTRKRLGP
jgi:DNA adenine methylase